MFGDVCVNKCKRKFQGTSAMKEIKLSAVRGLAARIRVGGRLADFDGVASKDLLYRVIYALNS